MARAGKKGKGGGMAARARQKASERESQFSGSKTLKFPSGEKPEFFKAKKGTFELDFMPYVVTDKKHPEGIPVGDHWFRRDFYAHRGIGIDEDMIVCPKTFGKKCPICEEYAILKSDKDADEDVVKALKPSLRQLYNVIDRGEAKKGIQLWDMSEFLFGRLLDEEIREGEEAYGGFAELEGGFTLSVRFKEDSFGGNSFSKASKISFDERDDYDAKFLKKAHDLDAILKVLTYEELYNLHHGIEDEEAEEREPEEPETEEEESPVEEEETGADDEFSDMDRKELKKYIKDNDLDIKVFRTTEDDELRESIRELVGTEPEEEAEEEEPVAEEEEAEEVAEGDEFDDMDRSELKKYIKKNDLDVKVFKKTEDDEIRDAIRAASDSPIAGGTTPGECPFGYTYGEDCDEFDECTECDAWEACEEKQQELKAAKRGKNKK